MAWLVKKFVLGATMAFLAGAMAFGQSQTSTGSLLAHMTGKWVMQGTIEGQKTTHGVEADWVLGREYIRLHEVSREKNPDGSPAYEAIVMIG
jgi:hypothetical protein